MDIETKSLRLLEFDKVKEQLAVHVHCEQSKNLCLLLQPFVLHEDIQRQIDFTKEAKSLLDSGMELPLEFVADVEEITKNGIHSYLSEENLIDIAKTLRTARIVKSFIRENAYDTLMWNLAFELYCDKELEERIWNTFDENFNVKRDATLTLSGLYSSLRETENARKIKINELLNSSEFSKNLQENIYTIREDRVVFQVKASCKGKIPGIVHDVSASNKSFYIEPAQIVQFNNKIREINSAIYAEIINILSTLTILIKEKLSEIKRDENILAEIDFHFAKARYAIKTDSVEPFLNNEKILEFSQMCHPLLIGNVETIVKNDLKIGDEYSSLVITGSNTGGKTVTIKTAGLFIIMAKSGMFLPCAEAKVYPFKKVLADVGDEQSVIQNLSTFSSHMTNLIQIVENCDSETFVALDEICAGTDPQEGAVLAEKILIEINKRNALTVVTTHFGELKTLEFNHKGFKNACVEFDTESLKPTYRLIIGIPGLSNAISIASNLGLPKNIIDEARSELTSGRDSSIVVVEKLQSTQQKLSQNLQEAETLKEDSLALKNEYEKKVKDVSKDKKKTLKFIKDRFENEINSAKDEIKEMLTELRKNTSEKLARRTYSRLANVEKKFRDSMREFDEAEKYEEVDWQSVKAGNLVILKELNKEVEVVSLPDKNGKVTVKMGNINTKVNKNKLAKYDKSRLPSFKPMSNKSQSFNLERYSMSSTLDLRGYTVEDGLDELEAYLDKASLANLTPVQVIHGHGSGALKHAVRDYLSTSPYVSKFRPGESCEGGDGVSVIDIN